MQSSHKRLVRSSCRSRRRSSCRSPCLWRWDITHSQSLSLRIWIAYRQSSCLPARSLWCRLWYLLRFSNFGFRQWLQVYRLWVRIWPWYNPIRGRSLPNQTPSSAIRQCNVHCQNFQEAQVQGKDRWILWNTSWEGRWLQWRLCMLSQPFLHLGLT